VLLLLVGGFLIFFLQDDSVPDRRIAREDSLGATGDGPDDLDELTETDAAVLDAMRKDRETGADTGETAPDDATGTDTAATATHESGETAAGPSRTTEDSAGETGAPGDEAP